MKNALTYKKAGVDIALANDCLLDIKKIVRPTLRPEVRGGIGGFGAGVRVPAGYRRPLLISSTDGAGTKLKLACAVGLHEGIGIDVVAMNVNDILCAGAQPLFFLDYFACGVLDRRIMTAVVAGVAAGCKQAGCALVGGETAEMPGMYPPGEYDIAGFCVGVVEEQAVVTGAAIKPGAVLIGLAASGLHANGFSLVRKIFSGAILKRRAAELLTPTRIYVKPVLTLLKKMPLLGIAHITGGAFYEKLVKIFPAGCGAVVRKNSWPVPPLFAELQKKGRVPETEMYRVFNMGVGMVLAVAPQHVDAARRHMRRHQIESWVIGQAEARRGAAAAVRFV